MLKLSVDHLQHHTTCTDNEGQTASTHQKYIQGASIQEAYRGCFFLLAETVIGAAAQLVTVLALTNDEHNDNQSIASKGGSWCLHPTPIVLKSPLR